MTPAAQEAIEKILALKDLTRETGNVTNRAQSLILRSLNESDLSDVALALRHLNSAGHTVTMTAEERAAERGE